MLLAGLATQAADGYAAGIPLLRRALRMLLDDPRSVRERSNRDQVGLLWFGGRVAANIWDAGLLFPLADRMLSSARASASVTLRAQIASDATHVALLKGDLSLARTLSDETLVMRTAAGLPPWFMRQGPEVTPGRENTRSRIIGSRVRSSTPAHTASSTTPLSRSATTRLEVHPHCPPSVIGSSRTTRAPARRSPPGRSTRPAVDVQDLVDDPAQREARRVGRAVDSSQEAKGAQECRSGVKLADDRDGYHDGRDPERADDTAAQQHGGIRGERTDRRTSREEDHRPDHHPPLAEQRPRRGENPVSGRARDRAHDQEPAEARSRFTQ